MSKSIFDFFKKEEVKVVFSEVKTIDGIVLQYDGELAEGTPLFVLDEEGNQIPAPEGEYQVEYEDQLWVVSIDVNGVLVKLEAVNVEEEPMSEEEPVNEMMSKQEFDAIIQQVITDTDSRITALETKFAELLEVKESKFKDERKKVEMSKELTVKEILTKK
ncbi:hypothetical protein UFOVP603_14 [uncultured Caudovirales phage]|uniref:Uncharacterized protein n=1 Tax=uncultured Caudovirales phage TaxID=2100421 RepID=A0A6J5N1L1_9CAUD|nr:hypothetical protein UFOVP603_14 [uncultured Caudovirales phage]